MLKETFWLFSEFAAWRLSSTTVGLLVRCHCVLHYVSTASQVGDRWSIARVPPLQPAVYTLFAFSTCFC